MPRSINKSPTLYERLADEKKRIEAALILVGPGSIRTKRAQKLGQLDVAAHMNEWLSSPGLRAPRIRQTQRNDRGRRGKPWRLLRMWDSGSGTQSNKCRAF